MSSVFASPLSGIVLCLLTYRLGKWIQETFKSPLLNPCILATVFCILFVCFTPMTLDEFNNGGDIVSLFIQPATAILALSIYRQRKILKSYFIPVVVGCSMGALTSIVSVFSLCKVFKLDQAILGSIVPKSVTTAIAIEISDQLGGIIAITILCVMITGMLGAVASPVLIKLFKIKDPVAQGVAIGASSHVLGTTKAVELGEIQGAMSGVSIGISGIVTLILTMFL